MSADRPNIDQLKSWLEFYREIGIEGLSLKPAVVNSMSYANQKDLRSEKGAVRESEAQRSKEARSLSLFEANLDQVTDDSLEKIREDIGDCQRCKLCSTRTHIVFGSGNPHARLVFVGEAPGADED